MPVAGCWLPVRFSPATGNRLTHNQSTLFPEYHIHRRSQHEIDELLLPLGAPAGQLRAVDEKEPEQAEPEDAGWCDPVEVLARGELEEAGQVEIAEKLHGGRRH